VEDQDLMDFLTEIDPQDQADLTKMKNQLRINIHILVADYHNKIIF
jgi:hypothetical protein